MGYAIIRTQKLKSGQSVRRSLAHAFREQSTPNADPSRRVTNSHFGATTAVEALERFNARLPAKRRKDAVLAIEYLVTGSPETMHEKSRAVQDAYFRDALAWLKAKHGDENVIYAGVHRDERTPHMYAYVVPIDDRGRLNCKAFLGGAKALNQMQTDFAEHVGAMHGLQRGVAGSRARHTTIQQYYGRIQAPVPEVRTRVPEVTPPTFFQSIASRLGIETEHSAALEKRAAAKAKRAAEIRKQQESMVAKAIQFDIERPASLARDAVVKKLETELAQTKAGFEMSERQLSYYRPIAQRFSPAEIEKKDLEAQAAQNERERIVAALKAKAATSQSQTSSERPGEAPDAPRGPKL